MGTVDHDPRIHLTDAENDALQWLVDQWHARGVVMVLAYCLDAETKPFAIMNGALSDVEADMLGETISWTLEVFDKTKATN